MDNPAPFFAKNSIALYHEDFIATQAIADHSIDLTITSPPYNIGIGYDNYNDAQSHEQYLAFSCQWLSRAFALAKPDGRLCMNIPLDTARGGARPVYSDLVAIAQSAGWRYQTTIIWNETNISQRTAWGSWLSASSPFVTTPAELIVVMYKAQWKKVKHAHSKSDIGRDEFIAWTNGMWAFNGESKKRVGHPAPFPRELPKRCIKLFSYVGDTVLDCFMGSGTTLLEAYANNRVGIGFDISAKYCALAQKRIEGLWRQPKLLGV